jgi:hypothetical protein
LESPSRKLHGKGCYKKVQGRIRGLILSVPLPNFLGEGKMKVKLILIGD